jgi:putative endonuclease
MRRFGYRLVERNFRTRRGEIDLILRRDSALVFVEVKLRRGTGYGHPLETVTERQKGRIRAAAEEWLALNDPTFENARFDVIGILIGDRGHEVVHVEDAF